jgi:DNA primase
MCITPKLQVFHITYLRNFYFIVRLYIMENNNIYNWLLSRKISSQVIEDFNIQYSDRIIIPIFNTNGEVIFNKYRRNPFITNSTLPKYTYDRGGTATLYGLHKIKEEHKRIVITESELCSLTLWSMNIPAVSSTGGAMTFKPEWALEFVNKEVFLCYDNDQAGRIGMVKVLKYLPNAKVIQLPTIANVKDVTDFVKVGGDFQSLMLTAESYNDPVEVNSNRSIANARFMEVSFYDLWLEEYNKKIALENYVKKAPKNNGDLEKAKSVSISYLLQNKKTQVKCLFHNESVASMHIYDDSSFYCFGCSKWGSAVDIYMQQSGCNFKEAVKYLKNL